MYFCMRYSQNITEWIKSLLVYKITFSSRVEKHFQDYVDLSPNPRFFVTPVSSHLTEYMHKVCIGFHSKQLPMKPHPNTEETPSICINVSSLFIFVRPVDLCLSPLRFTLSCSLMSTLFLWLNWTYRSMYYFWHQRDSAFTIVTSQGFLI